MNIKKLNKYVTQVMRNFPNVDGIIITDTDAVVRYYFTAYENMSNVAGSEIIGKNILEFYPELTEENSYIFKCIRTGKAFLNYEQALTDVNGNKCHSICMTVPIHDGGELVAIAELSIYPDKTVAEEDKKIEVASRFQDEHTNGTLDDIITACPALIEIKKHIEEDADSDAPVLVYGKTGTGKELICTAIHNCSSRAGKPFIIQNCAAIPSTLLESLLFGNVKGSFTGAEDSIGLFEMANHGTLFLDEINSMEIEAQAKILRALEEKKIRKIGAKKTNDIDVRVIAAVNEDPLECIRKKTLRDDLYYRLSVIRYDIPQLKERREDIPLLMEHFRRMYNEKFGKNIVEFSPEVETAFLRYDWPGNVRELKNVVEAAYHLNFGATIELENIPRHIAERMNIESISLDSYGTLPLSQMVAEFEKEIIKRKYIKNGRRLSQTARELAISKQSLLYKLKKYELM